MEKLFICLTKQSKKCSPNILVNIIILSISVVTFLGEHQILYAQPNSESCWKVQEELISPEPGVLDIGTSLIADAYGNAHLAWLRMTEDRSDTDIIYYSRWDGEQWSFPSDIIAETSEYSVQWPVLRFDLEGRLHLFWLANFERIMHSQALIQKADFATDWTPPETIGYAGESSNGPIDVYLDAREIFHFVLTANEGDVYYFTWDGSNSSYPIAVSSVREGEAARFAKITEDSLGKLHVVWTVFDIDAGETVSVNYALSNDNGISWSDGIQIAGKHHADPNIIANEGQVFIAWNGGVRAGGRYFQEFDVSGSPKSDPVLVSRRAGQASYPSIMFDASNKLHLFTGDGEYIKKDHLDWSDPVRFPEAGINIEQARMALVGGNQLVAIWPNNFSGIYYTTCTMDLPVDIRALPEPVDTVVVMSDPTETPAVTEPAAPVNIIDINQPSPPNNWAGIQPLALSLFATLIVILIGIAFRKIRRDS